MQSRRHSIGHSKLRTSETILQYKLISRLQSKAIIIEKCFNHPFYYKIKNTIKCCYVSLYLNKTTWRQGVGMVGMDCKTLYSQDDLERALNGHNRFECYLIVRSAEIRWWTVIHWRIQRQPIFRKPLVYLVRIPR